jgi:REP-associated tyrosine transposase
MNRGHNRERIFDEDADYTVFLKAVHQACSRHDVEIHGFALMKNHFHLLVTPPTPVAIGKATKAFESKYCYYYNRKHRRIGSIWNGRYHDVPIESGWHWLVCLRYIELNPVRAGIVEDPAAYRWTSYQVHAAGSGANPWLASHPVYEKLGASAEERHAVYRAICTGPLSEAELTLMRNPPVVQLAATG